MDNMDNWKNVTSKELIDSIDEMSKNFGIDVQKTKNDKASLIAEYQRMLSYGLDNFLFFLI